LNRISGGRDGVDILCKSSLVALMIKSFLKFSEVLETENGPFLIYLLETFINIFQYDSGISFFLGSGFMGRLNYMLTSKAITDFNHQFAHRVHQL
jgi:hypothetical protein